MSASAVPGSAGAPAARLGRAPLDRAPLGRAPLGRALGVAGAVVLAGHGLIHLLGVALYWRLGETGELRYADARPEPGSLWGLLAGGVWLLATALFLATAVLLLRRSAAWRVVGALAVLASVPVLLPMAADTGAGLAVDLGVLTAVLTAVLVNRRVARAEAGSGGRTEPAPVGRVPGEARRVRAAWLGLASPPAPEQVFSTELVAALPEPARRWLTHAIPVGTPLYASAQVTMHGEIRLGTWRRFRAHQVVAPHSGYIWAATAWLAGLPVRGFDRFSTGSGEMRWRLLGLIPVVTATGADVTRSAAGRLVSEIVLAPTGFQAATWLQGRSADHVVGTWSLAGEDESVELHIGPGGQVLSVLVSRWGNPTGEPFGRYPFGCTVHSERAFHGVTIPHTVSAGWWWGTDRYTEGEFFRATITALSHA
jgi:hypothetical protein